MTGATSIRDVIAFPKTKTAECPLTQAPAPVEANQLRDLGIRLREQQRKKLNLFNKNPAIAGFLLEIRYIFDLPKLCFANKLVSGIIRSF